MKLIIALFAALALCLSACTSTPPDIGVKGYDRLIEERGPDMDADRLELIVTRRNQLAEKAGVDLIEVPNYNREEN